MTGRIDVHHHVVPPRYRQRLSRAGVSAGGRGIPEWSADASLELMQRNGIETAILSITTPGVEPWLNDGAREFARELNEFCAGLAAEHPGRFGFWATLTLPDVNGAVHEAAYALDELHADGVVLLANSNGTYLGDPEFDPLMAELDARAAVVFVHPSALPAEPVSGVPPYAADFLLDTTRAAANLAARGVPRRFPNIKIILPHAGGFLPYAAERIAGSLALDDPSRDAGQLLADLRGFYFDTALSASEYSLPALTRFAEPGHVLFGSDFPYATAEMATWFTGKLDAWDGIDHAEVDRVNAGRLLPRFG
ncbi:MAG: amidohydrolase [Saccharopolyspora sp.]|uniref:amidohydrolase family protein n=1 Tax=Saccharopolyspora sp. TaxID=33915 RepID=UPI0025E0C3F9|nr:amidohydrolase family protein [Saccharopolyspora sp.]MBQ6644873.1 amidohydrolase [Saccharopolyspora sp.]